MSTATSRGTRKSIPLSDQELADLEALRGSAPHRRALAEMIGLEEPGSASEAQFLRWIHQVGMRAVREQVEAHGYAAMAADASGRDAERRAVARRRRPTWADEG